MYNDPSFDNYAFSNDNSSKHEDNDGEVVVRKEDLKRINDPNCRHSNIKRDDTDTIGDTVAWVCQDCGRGTFLPKTITKLT